MMYQLLQISLLIVTLCLSMGAQSQAANLTQQEIDKRVETIEDIKNRAQHNDACLLKSDIKTVIKDLKRAETEPLRRLYYDVLEDRRYCDEEQNLRCEKHRRVCICSGENAFWIPDQPYTNITRNGKCVLPFNSPCHLGRTPCAEGGLCKVWDNSESEYNQSDFILNAPYTEPRCRCKDTLKNSTNCTDFMGMSHLWETKLDDLLERLRNLSLATINETCDPKTNMIYDSRQHNLWDFWALIVDQEGKAPADRIFNKTCNFTNSLECSPTTLQCQCRFKYVWDPENKTCNGQLEAPCKSSLRRISEIYQPINRIL